MKWIKKSTLMMVMVMLVPMVFLVGCGNSREVGGDYKQTEGDFMLFLSVDNERIQQGQSLNVEMLFKNLSGTRHEIRHSTPLIMPFIAGGLTISTPEGNISIYSPIRDLGGITSIFEIGEERTVRQVIGQLLPRGRHTLVADAVFSLGESTEVVRVISNSVSIRVD